MSERRLFIGWRVAVDKSPINRGSRAHCLPCRRNVGVRSQIPIPAADYNEDAKPPITSEIAVLILQHMRMVSILTPRMLIERWSVNECDRVTHQQDTVPCAASRNLRFERRSRVPTIDGGRHEPDPSACQGRIKCMWVILEGALSFRRVACIASHPSWLSSTFPDGEVIVSCRVGES